MNLCLGSAEWRIFGKSQYLPVFTMKTWINAQRDCLSNGSRLTEIETVEEYDFVKNIARELNAEYVFIGGTDAFEEGNMVWWSTLQSVDPGLHHLWSPNQPDNFNNNEHCMNLIKPEDYKLNDGSCQSKYPFICERNI
ncbi:C-type lectin domain family 4 member K-like [Saccostrea echinata]|uniref:C-type lectin domain family 4 member K-like n=1 Tax=Saccostrea echinata TaxID=191078 RepID=UPI002A829CA1|nr:C-type lectin domain family 4 member K-like [Saccostrea echinata]